MTATSHLRGHEIYSVNGKWYYSDNDKPTESTWSDRSCGHCGLFGNSNYGKPDPCIGLLPYVSNACCGHGVRKEAYIIIKGNGGVCLRGFTASIVVDLIKLYRKYQITVSA